MQISLVAAVALNGVIGADNQLLWRLKTDLQHFRRLTLGKPVIMGRKTFDSIGKPLPGRDIIVVTRDKACVIAGVHVVHSIEAALAAGRDVAIAKGGTEIMVAGGGEIYAQTLVVADRLYLTKVMLEPEGDAYFPHVDAAVWSEISSRSHAAGPDDEAAFTFIDYSRR